MTKLIGHSLRREAVGIGEIIVVAWEACVSSEVEHGQWLLGVSFPIYLMLVVSLGEAKLTKALVLPLPAQGGQNLAAARVASAMATIRCTVRAH